MILSEVPWLKLDFLFDIEGGFVVNQEPSLKQEIMKADKLVSEQAMMLSAALASHFEQMIPEPISPFTEEQEKYLKLCRTFRKYEVSQSIVIPELPKAGFDELFSLVPESEAYSYVEQLKKNARCYPDNISDFLPDYYIESRERLKESPSVLDTIEETLICHEYVDVQGRYRTYYIPGNLDNLARFICSSDNYKLVCNGMDHLVICTIGEYVDLIRATDTIKAELYAKLSIYQHSAHRPVFKQK